MPIQLSRPSEGNIVGCKQRATDKQALALRSTLDLIRCRPSQFLKWRTESRMLRMIDCIEQTNNL